MTSLNAEYTTLGNYLSKQQYSIPSAGIQPTMDLPVLPLYTGGYGLTTLTHDANGVGYHGIENAYSCSKIQTTFNYSTCPQNIPQYPFVQKKT